MSMGTAVGTNSVPLLRELNQLAADVDLASTNAVRQQVVGLLRELQNADAHADMQLLSVDELRQAHPADVSSHMAQMRRYDLARAASLRRTV
jgi:hypothetical protein